MNSGPGAVPPQLERLVRIRDQQLAIARQSLFGPANSYITAWGNAQAVDRTHKIEMNAYRQQRDYANAVSGELSSIMGEDASSIVRPKTVEVPTSQIMDTLVSVDSSAASYKSARDGYNLEAEKIQLEFEKQISSILEPGNGLSPPPPPFEPYLEAVVGKAEYLLGRHDGAVRGFLWGFGSN